MSVYTVTVEAGVSTRVRPSGGEFLSISMAMRPAAPGRLSTMTLRAKPGASLSPRGRLTRSHPPPRGKTTGIFSESIAACARTRPGDAKGDASPAPTARRGLKDAAALDRLG